MILIDMGAIIRKSDVMLAIYNPKPGVNAIEIRKMMMQLPEVANALNTIEKYVFAASTKSPISEMDDQTLAAKLSALFKRIAYDVGYNIPQDVTEWQYIQTRLLDILKRYFSRLTLADVKMAFELVTTGELDEFLPRDVQGNPDRKHYQQFNAEYLSKILNAYQKKQTAVIAKAFEVLPKPKETITAENAEKIMRERMDRNRTLFLQYKYTGKIGFILSDEMFVYKWLRYYDLADEVKENQDDRKESMRRYMKRVYQGFVNRDEAFFVRRQGLDSPELDATAYEIAQRREIIKAFDRMIAEEIQVDNFSDPTIWRRIM